MTLSAAVCRLLAQVVSRSRVPSSRDADMGGSRGGGDGGGRSRLGHAWNSYLVKTPPFQKLAVLVSLRFREEMTVSDLPTCRAIDLKRGKTTQVAKRQETVVATSKDRSKRACVRVSLVVSPKTVRVIRARRHFNGTGGGTS